MYLAARRQRTQELELEVRQTIFGGASFAGDTVFQRAEFAERCYFINTSFVAN